MVDALVKTYRYEGIRGLYKGFLPGVFGVSHGALQFMAYEEMKNSYNKYRNLPIDTKLVSRNSVPMVIMQIQFSMTSRNSGGLTLSNQFNCF